MMQLGIVERAYPGEEKSGDGYFFKEYDNRSLIALVDGLGHGPEAGEVAQIAVEYIEEHYQNELVEIIKGCHESLRNTRGAAIGLTRIDYEDECLTFIGIGNIEIRVVGETAHSLISMPGILGYQITRIRPDIVVFHPGDMVIMHSDGISSRFVLSDYPGLFQKEAQQIAETIFHDHARENDDATILVIRNSSEGRSTVG